MNCQCPACGSFVSAERIPQIQQNIESFTRATVPELKTEAIQGVLNVLRDGYDPFLSSIKSAEAELAAIRKYIKGEI